MGVDIFPHGGKESPQVATRIEQLPFNDGTFNVVVSIGTVFDSSVYVQNQQLMMQEISRVLKQGGVYYNSFWRRAKGLSPIAVFNEIPKVSNEFRSVYKKS